MVWGRVIDAGLGVRRQGMTLPPLPPYFTILPPVYCAVLNPLRDRHETIA